MLDAMRSLVNTRDLQLLMCGSEMVLWKEEERSRIISV